MTTIFQVTDPHIPVNGDMAVRENFLQLMAYCEQQQPDLLAITGDLPGEDGSRAAYEWIESQLPAGIDHVIIPGNHDDRDILFSVFAGKNNQNTEFMEKIALDEIDVLFVDSGSTWLPAEQIAFLKSHDVRPGSVLFIHHPTKLISGGFMDLTYALRNRDETDAAISDSNIEHVFCGHFHTEFEIHDDYHLYVTPSCAFEVARDSAVAKIGPPRVPVREINITGQAVTSTVTYL